MGIPHYWIVDSEPPVTITTHVLVDGAYRPAGSATGQDELVVDKPFHVSITAADLAATRDA